MTGPAATDSAVDELTDVLLGFAAVDYPPDVRYHPDVRDQARKAASEFLERHGAGLEEVIYRAERLLEGFNPEQARELLREALSAFPAREDGT